MNIIIEKNGPVTTVVINRPKVKNAVDRQTAQELADTFRDFERDLDAKVGVLCGADGTFCAGADLKAIAAGEPNRVESDGDSPMGPCRLLLSKPIIAAISGYAVGGGLELALWCDLRIIEEDSVVGYLERRWGVPLIDGGTVRLSRIIGLGRALDLILTGRPVRANEALSMGLVNRIVPKGRARQEAEALALELCQFPQVCMRNDRLSVYEQFGMTLDEALKNEFRHGVEALKSEALAGAKRFVKGDKG